MKGKEIFKNLCAELARAGLSFPSLADTIGMGLSTIYSKKSGSRDWTLADMTAIQTVLQDETGLDLPLDYLFKREEAYQEGD